MPEHYDKSLIAYWDNQQGMLACYGRKGNKGFPTSMRQIILNASARGAVHAR